jgi:myo-inositol-1(or 4)-monophosphatase
MRKGALNIAIKAARTAGQTILRSINRLDSIPVIEKGRFDFASEVDLAAEADIVREIKRAYPEHAILAEESGQSGQSRFTWVIDPLDGTHNYLRGFPHYCVSIALLEQDEPIHGVVYDPLRDELFAASKGSGAVLNDRRLRIGQRQDLNGALLCTGFPFRQPQHKEAHLEMLKSALSVAEDVRRTGSAALDLCYVAANRTDGYWEMGLKPWDMAAGALIVREAGGRCCDFRGDAHYMKTGQIVASNVKLCDAMLEWITPHQPK